MTCMKNHRQIINSGFSLIEAVVVIAITGVIIAIVGKVLLSAPVTGYVDTARRAEMVDIADTALRRMGRDLHNALPNSVRVTPDAHYLEYLDVRTGGRYRAGPHTNAISSISVANPTVMTTAAPHGMSTGTQVLCSGTNSTPIADGT
ncbi:MAG TPA: prepilin-type N-terminal cleavage/methylation domain-containing protein, partial [Burkholderiales bacterium]|nr:prepilin-type N-terminal cleavage/methylation domain-containing protein [Burkholderiales bacterium]